MASGDGSGAGGFPGGIPGMPGFSPDMLEGLMNDPAIRRMTEAITQDPAFLEFAREMQSSMLAGGMGGLNLGGGAPPGAAAGEEDESEADSRDATSAGGAGGMPGFPGLGGMMGGMDPSKYMEAMNRMMSNPEFVQAATEMGRTLMSQTMDPASAAMLELMQNPEHAETLKTKMEELKEDPELKEVIEEMEKDGQAAMMKYMADPEIMAKFGKKFQEAVADIPAFQAALTGAEGVASAGNEEEEEGDENTVLGAASAGNADRLRELLKAGEDPNSQDEEKRTALHFAAGYGELACMEVLLENGANVDARDKDDNTALHYAAGYGVVEAAQLLLTKGADKSLANAEGKTALQVAEMNEQKDIVAALKG